MVSDSAGEPVAGARVYFTEGPGSFPDIAAMTGPDGAFILAAPTTGTYTLACAAGDHDPISITVEVTPDRQTVIEIRV